MPQASTYPPDYTPEQHAPDPVLSHGDPTPPGKVGIWLFLASEIMFFIGILGSYIVIRSGWPMLFEQQGKALNKVLAGINTLVLIFSSLTMALAVDAARKGDRKRLITCLAITFACAATFMGIKYVEYTDKFHHYTMVVTVKAAGDEDAKPVSYLYDGHWDRAKNEVKGVRMELDKNVPVDIGFTGKAWIEERMKAEGKLGTGDKLKDEVHAIPKGATIVQATAYGPWKNLFLASYFASTGVHGLHVIGGMIPLAILTIQAMRRKIFPRHTEYVGLYWHFVDLVWIFLFPLLYLI